MLRDAGRVRGVGAGPVGGWGGARSALPPRGPQVPPAEGGARAGGTPGGLEKLELNRVAVAIRADWMSTG